MGNTAPGDHPYCSYPLVGYLVVDEGKTSDQVVEAIRSVGDVVTEQFQSGQHGKTSVPED